MAELCCRAARAVEGFPAVTEADPQMNAVLIAALSAVSDTSGPLSTSSATRPVSRRARTSKGRAHGSMGACAGADDDMIIGEVVLARPGCALACRALGPGGSAQWRRPGFMQGTTASKDIIQ